MIKFLIAVAASAIILFGAAPASAGGLVTVDTAANRITVAADAAGKFVGVIRDLVAAGFRGRVNCYASGGHVAHSLHYTGHACDFAQTGRNRVAAGAGVMYHAGRIAAAHGLRDGCTFHDCGHLDTGAVSRSYSSRRRTYDGMRSASTAQIGVAAGISSVR